MVCVQFNLRRAERAEWRSPKQSGPARPPPPQVFDVPVRILGSMHGLRSRYPEYFGRLAEVNAMSLEAAISRSISLGWEPTDDDVRDLCEVAAGQLSETQMVARALTRYAKRSQLRWLRACLRNR